jgi:AraC-like DNA-binding protein
MIALVRLLPPIDSCVTVTELDHLPTLETATHSGYFVLCQDKTELYETLAWHAALRALVPSVGLGLVCPPEISAAALRLIGQNLRPVLYPHALPVARVPSAALEDLRSRSIEGQIFRELCETHQGRIEPHTDIVEALIAHAIQGGTASGVARRLGLSVDTLRRRLQVIGLQPGSLIPQIRLRGYELRVESGDSPTKALLACGWTDPKAHRKVCARKRAPN